MIVFNIKQFIFHRKKNYCLLYKREEQSVCAINSETKEEYSIVNNCNNDSFIYYKKTIMKAFNRSNENKCFFEFCDDFAYKLIDLMKKKNKLKKHFEDFKYYALFEILLFALTYTIASLI